MLCFHRSYTGGALSVYMNGVAAFIATVSTCQCCPSRRYGDDYACNDTTTTIIPGGSCPAKLFGNKPWSQMGLRLQYEQAQNLLNSNDSVTGLIYNHTTASVHFDYICPPSNITSTGESAKDSAIVQSNCVADISHGNVLRLQVRQPRPTPSMVRQPRVTGCQNGQASGPKH